jgi:DNA-binding transcriptional ArsR family regulator
MLDLKLQAISQPNRRKILQLIRDQELSAGEIAGHFRVTRPAVSQHLQLLVQAGLVDLRRRGTSRLYRARPDGLDEIRTYLEAFWQDRLGESERAAEGELRSAAGKDRG